MISRSILLPFPLSSVGQLDSNLVMFQVLGAYQPEKNRLWGLVPEYWYLGCGDWYLGEKLVPLSPTWA